jgi:hypothetical protein
MTQEGRNKTMQEQKEYQIGDIANGHQLTPQGWMPVVVQVVQPRKKRHWLRWSLIAVVAIFVISGISNAMSSGDATPKDSVAPAHHRAQAAAPGHAAKQDKPARKAPVKPAMTAAQENAVDSAKNYLSFESFSRAGLIQQLSSKAGDGFAKKDAVFAVNHITVDWNEQAAKSAKNYLSMTSFSRAGLIQQLSSKAGDQFTHAQAVYGVNKAGL